MEGGTIPNTDRISRMASKAQDGGMDTAAKSGTVEAPKAFTLLLRKMAAMATMEETQGTSGTTEDIDRILAAEDESEMWESDELAKWNATKLSGCDLQTLGFEVKFSGGANSDIKTPFVDPETQKQMFLLVHSFRVNGSGNTKEYNLPPVGEIFTWNTSARNIVPKFFWMLAHGWFDEGAKPVRFRIVGTKTSAGSVEKLKELPAGTVIEESSPITVEGEPPF
jgi:hypothetical protein